jgi:hypothetical protein
MNAIIDQKRENNVRKIIKLLMSSMYGSISNPKPYFPSCFGSNPSSQAQAENGCEQVSHESRCTITPTPPVENYWTTGADDEQNNTCQVEK